MELNKIITIPMLPSPDGQIQPCPELLTPAETIRFLRLDVDGPSDPLKTLQYSRDKGLLRGIQVGKRLRYTRTELLNFLNKLSERAQAKCEPYAK